MKCMLRNPLPSRVVYRSAALFAPGLVDWGIRVSVSGATEVNKANKVNGPRALS